MMSNLATLQKGNRQVTVDERDARGYMMRGYNKIDENGDVIEYAIAGGTVTLQEHNKVLAELDAIEKGNEGSGDVAKRLESALAEVQAVKEDLAAMEADNERLSEELKKLRNQQKQRQ